MDTKTVSVLLLIFTVTAAGCTAFNGEQPQDPGNETDLNQTTEEPPEEPQPSEYRVEAVSEGLEHPWGMAHLPDNESVLVSERTGALKLVERNNGSAVDIDGVPNVSAEGQGGLLDVELHPNFENESWVYMTYSVEDESGNSTTRVGRGELNLTNDTLEEFETLYTAEPFVDSERHYGSRMVFDDDGYLYVTVGDREFKDFGPEHVSQNLSNDLGTTLRLEEDGSIPEDNPFVDRENATDAIFTYGHRNVQGMALHPETGDIWQNEHGEQDGDEINILEAGGNYGWPVTHYGCDYETGEPIGEPPHERNDTIDPVHHWDCGSGGFAPSGLTVYTGHAFENWEGDLFMGNLADGYLGRFSVNGTNVSENDRLLEDRNDRIRDVEEAPDTGYLYVLVDDDDAPLLRIREELELEHLR